MTRQSDVRRVMLLLLASGLTVCLFASCIGLPHARGPVGRFTIVALPDTQNYTANKSGGTSTIFVAQADWIVSNRVDRNIAYVAHLGDITEDGGLNRWEWQNATNALYRLENPTTTGMPSGIPYGVAVGNHDIRNSGSELYDEYFGAQHYRGRTYYGGHWDGNTESFYDLFSADGMEFVAVSLTYSAGSNSNLMSWANQVLKSHADRQAIVFTHSLIMPGDPGAWTPEGQPIFDALKGNPNLFLMLCGHRHGAGIRREQVAGRTIYILLSDYQAGRHGGDGYMRVMTFSAADRKIRVDTCSPVLNAWMSGASNSFSLAWTPARLGSGR